MKILELKYPDSDPEQKLYLHEIEETGVTGRETEKSKIISSIIQDFSGRSDAVLHKEASGKPFAKIGDQKIEISISHTGALLLVACHSSKSVGVDLEKSDRKVMEALRRRMRNSEELESDIALLTNIQIWTAKEAVLKCMGTGLRYPMRKIRLFRAESQWKAEAEGKLFKLGYMTFREFQIAVATLESESQLSKK